MVISNSGYLIIWLFCPSTLMFLQLILLRVIILFLIMFLFRDSPENGCKSNRAQSPPTISNYNQSPLPSLIATIVASYYLCTLVWKSSLSDRFKALLFVFFFNFVKQYRLFIFARNFDIHATVFSFWRNMYKPSRKFLSGVTLKQNCFILLW